MTPKPFHAQLWLNEHEEALLGLHPDDAIALVEEADLHAQVHPKFTTMITADWNRNRVNLWLDDTEVVQRVTSG